jgi:hypothetical protein
MPDAYAYNAALICEDCARPILQIGNASGASCGRGGHSGFAIDCDDSDCKPQGPYADGGGESDSPQACDTCLLPLDNSLTPDGVEYVLNACRESEAEPDSALRATHAAYTGTYWEDSPHGAIVASWAEALTWYGGLSDDDESLITRVQDRMSGLVAVS